MGVVYLVERQISETTLYFALKTLRHSFVKDEKRQQLFLRELQTWIDLPDHLHLNTCFFFRTIDNRLTVFSEYISGGSLAEWIQTKQLTDVEQILDIAIQVAWGLQAAHDHEVVHQDVKPANILMTPEGQAKLTDFGLARARGLISIETAKEDSQTTLQVSSAGMTLAYCSPEQAFNSTVSRRSDIWSLGLTILEMFKGQIDWHMGTQAEGVLTKLLHDKSEARIFMPDTIGNILEKCFRKNPDDRWKSMDELAQNLICAYEEETDHPYTRKRPSYPINRISDKDSKDRLTRGGNQYLDPVEWLARGYKLAGKPFNADKLTKEYASKSRRAQALLDLERYEEVQNIYHEQIQNGQKELEDAYYELLFQKSWIYHSIGDLPGAIANVEYMLSLWLDRESTSGLSTWASAIATLYMAKASDSAQLGKHDQAIEAGKDAIRRFGELIQSDPQPKYLHKYAMTHMNLGGAYWGTGEIEKAVDCLKLATDTIEKLVVSDGKDEYIRELTMLYKNRAFTLLNLGKSDEALEYLDRSIDLISSSTVTDRNVLISELLTMVYNTKASVLDMLGRTDEVLFYYDLSIDILEAFVYEEGRLNFSNDLAWLYNNKGIHLSKINKDEEALDWFHRAIDLREKMIYRRGQFETLPELAKILTNRADTLDKLKWFEKSEIDYQCAMDIWHRLDAPRKATSFRADYTKTRTLRAILLNKTQTDQSSENELQLAVAEIESELKKTDRTDLKDIARIAHDLMSDQTG